MSWIDYYRLLEKYNGDLSKASKEEISSATQDNPNDPPSTLALARKKFYEKMAREFYNDVADDYRLYENVD